MVKHNRQQRLASIFLVLALAFSLSATVGISVATRAQEPTPSPVPSASPGFSPTPAASLSPSASPSPSPSPTPAAESSSNKVELHQALLDFTNPWTVMCVAAHPDDEDGTTLTVLRRRDGARTVRLCSTFG